MKTKKAIVLSMAALAAQAAMRDIKAEYGKDTIRMDKDAMNIVYDYNPYDGMIA